MLDGAAQEAGFRSIAFEAIGSTNDEGLARARAGDPGRLWIRAQRQLGGRGRRGRSWASEPGNLYASLLLVDPAPQALVPQLGFVAGVALAAAVRRLTGPAATVRLKWPNDLLVDGAKLAGILVEGTVLDENRFACVIGIGVNCATHPDGLAYPATDLSAATGRPQSSDELFRHLTTDMACVLALWDHGRGFGVIRERWLAAALPRGARLRAMTDAGMLEGAFETLDDGGRLLLRTAAGLATIDAGDVFAIQSSESAGFAAG